MVLRLTLSPENEQKLRERAQAAGLSPEEYALRAVEETLSHSGERVNGPEHGGLPREEAQRRAGEFRKWVVANARPGTPGTIVDDSRESIYRGCGE